MTTARYQGGSIALKKRSKGADVWEFRWRDATGTQLSKLLGTVERYPTKRDAQCAADAFRLEVNAELPTAVPITVATLVDRYLQDKIEMDRLAFSTKKSYETHLGHWVKPKWGEHRLEQVRTMAVEQWLRDLLLAPRTKVHLRNTLHVLFECAARWELIKDNPITRVRQGGSRLTEPDVLTPDEFHSLLKELKDERVRTMVVLAGCLGLSRSEFIGLKWSDFNWAAGTLTVQRGVVHNHVGKTKTQARRKPVPLAPELVSILEEWRAKTPYSADSDWLFASEFKNGVEPYWPDSLLKHFVKPAAVRAEITKRVGWHTFRHSYSTQLRANGTDIKVQQELLRHSNVQTTLQVYTQAISTQKREAHERVVGQLLFSEPEEVAASA
jgi:integrase